MACPHNHSPGAAVHSARSAGVLGRSLSPFNAAEACERRFMDKPRHPQEV